MNKDCLYKATVSIVLLISSYSQMALCAEENKSEATPDQNHSNLHEGTDFKIGPVTDDSKLIKPVAGEKNKSVSDSDEKKPEKKASEEEAGMRDERRTNRELQIDGQGKISVGALKVARDLEVFTVIEKLAEWRQEHGNVRDAHDLESLALRQQLHEDLFSSFMQTRRVTSELERQISGYDAVARVLEDKRDQAIRNNNILNFTSAGALASTQGGLSVGTPMNFQNAGNELSIIAGGVTALIGAYALKIQKGARRSAELEPNMLAAVFDLAPVEPNKYPPVIWNYLNSCEPGQKHTRREQLIQRWRTLNYIEKDYDKKGVEKLKALCGTVPLKKKVTIDLLRTRIPMLEDLRATVAGMNEYIDEILSFVRGPERPSIKYRTSAKIINVLKGDLDEKKKAK